MVFFLAPFAVTLEKKKQGNAGGGRQLSSLCVCVSSACGPTA